MQTTQLPACCSAPEALWPFTLPLPGVQLHSCHFDPAALTPDAFMQAGIGTPLSIQRAAAKRQAEFLAGRLCARAALNSHARQLAQPDQDAEGTPLWPSGMCGSITHSQGMAAAVVASQKHWLSLGLDAEAPMSATRARRLARQILTPGELQRLQCQPETEHAWLISLTFSSKESLFKALYPLVGQRFYFQDAELLDCRSDGQLQLRLLRDLAAQWPSGSLLTGQHATSGKHLLSLVSIANPASAETPAG